MKSKISIAIILLFLCPFLYAAQDYEVLQSTNSFIVVKYSPQYSDTGTIKISNSSYRNIGLNFGHIVNNNLPGMPALPSRTLNIGVPSEYGNTVQVLSTQYHLISGKPLPIPKLGKNKSFTENIYEEANEYSVDNDEELVEFGEFGYTRNLPVQSIRINPVRYDAKNNKITLFTEIVFRVNFGRSTQSSNEKADESVKLSVINFKEAKNWGRSRNALSKKIENSVLASGTWYKFEAPKEGIYRINRSQLSNLGIDAGTVDPRTIKIYNNGGMLLPEKVTADAPTDLVEIAIKIVGEDDGVFNDGDYILFYGRGVDFWKYDPGDHEIIRNRNYASQKNYFWITSGGSNGKRIEAKLSVNLTPDLEQTTTKSFVFHESDNINLGESGRDYWGEELTASNSSLTFLNSLNELFPNSEIEYSFRLVVASSPSINLSITENGNQILSRTYFGYGNDLYIWGRAYTGNTTFNGSIPNNRSVLKFQANNVSSDARLLLDYFEISFERYLRAVDDQLIFFAEDAADVIKYNLRNFSNSSIDVYDISDYAEPKIISNAEISGGEYSFIADESASQLTKYLAVTPAAYLSITNIQKVENSNVNGISPGAKYILITHKNFKEQAERMANYRQNESPNSMSTVVVFIDEIFNEFSGGSIDPTAIRNFLKYAYENWEVKPFYVLLFGDGTYDYYDLEGFGTNYIPTYQTPNSVAELSSYTYDDYYSRISGDDEKADIAIGRVNVTSATNAKNYVDKVIEYESDLARGLWRNKVTLVADDGLTSSSNDGSIHTSQAETLAEQILPAYLDKSKIFLSKYPTVITGLGRRKPAVNEAIITAVNEGTLLLNYTGHGNPDTWAHEFIFERSVTLQRFNNDKYFFLTAATCDFGRYDDPNRISSTEEMVLQRSRGAIGVFSAARLVFSGPNAEINEAFYNHLFNDSTGISLGEAFYLTKQTFTDTNDEKYHLFCDPAIILNRPKLPVAIEKVNNTSLDVAVQVKALGEVSVEGSVRLDSTTIDTGFNGEGIISVFDSERTIYLEDIRYTILEQGGVIFRGRVSITNGKFSTSFRVPKDISYENKNGKIIAYVFDENEDGVGYTNKIIVGGTDTTVTDDGEGPEISIFFDNLEFDNASIVQPDFRLLVKLKDETGLNTTGTGVGHRLEGIIDDDIENPVDFSESFIGDLDAGGKSGVIDHPFSDVEIGEHKILVKAWDVFNNGSDSETFFSVLSSNDLAVRDVYNYPNPFGGNTTFTFQHNLNSAVDVKIKVYTVAGRMIKEIEKFGLFDRFVRIDWDGRDEDGSELANGTYLYKLIVKSSDGQYSESILGKLAVFH